MEFYHSAKGSTWKNHKYIAIKNGRYIYPKREGARSRTKISSLVSNSSNIVKGATKVNLKSDGKLKSSSSNAAVSISEQAANNYKPIEKDDKNLVQYYLDRAERTKATQDAAQKTMEAGEKAIKKIFGSPFDLTRNIKINTESGAKITLWVLEEKQR